MSKRRLQLAVTFSIQMAAAGATALPAAGTIWQSAAHAAGLPAYDPGAGSTSSAKSSPAEHRRPHADGPDLSAQGARAFPDRSRSARRRVEQQGSLRRRADGSRAGGERRAGRRRRPDARARGAVSGLRAGRELGGALAQGECRHMERRRSKIGVYGSSSGGHVAELLAMRPHDPRYGAIPLAAAPNVDARVAWVAMRSPISDTFARYQNAERRKNEGMIKNNKMFFSPWETIHESNPQEILERKEKVALPPLLIMQGALDDNVLPAMQEKFANDLSGGRRQLRLSAVRERRPRMGRRARSADRQGARDRQGIHRPPAQG